MSPLFLVVNVILGIWAAPAEAEQAVTALSLHRDSAANEREARRAYDRGRAAYASAAFREAAGWFERSYRNGGPVEVLFNLGQAHRRAGDCARAHEAYRRFLEEAPGAAQTAVARRHLESTRACTPSAAAPERAAAPAAARTAAAPERAAAPKEPTPQVPAAPSATVSPAPWVRSGTPREPTRMGGAAAVAAPSPQRRGAGLRTAGLVTAGIGGAALVTGAVLGTQDDDDDGAFGPVLLWGGGSALVVGAALGLWGHARLKTTTATLAPTPGGAMFALGWQLR